MYEGAGTKKVGNEWILQIPGRPLDSQEVKDRALPTDTPLYPQRSNSVVTIPCLTYS